MLIDPDRDKREVLAERLRAQGYDVQAEGCPTDAIGRCLAEPPSAVIADLWMPSISGVQLCRLLRSEASTSSVPVILRAVERHPRNRFWAERAGAAAYVNKGRMGMLVRALGRAIARSPEEDGFLTHLSHAVDIRERICRLLDKELYESVLAGEVRSLSSCETFPRLFDLLSQFVCQVSVYRWLALRTPSPARVALHCHPEARKRAQQEVCEHLGITVGDVDWLMVEDEDAVASGEKVPPQQVDVVHSGAVQGTLVIAPSGVEMAAEDTTVARLVASELGGPLRIVTLVEETQRLASYDPLTDTMNRRAFTDSANVEMARGGALRFQFDVPSPRRRSLQGGERHPRSRQRRRRSRAHGPHHHADHARV